MELTERSGVCITEITGDDGRLPKDSAKNTVRKPSIPAIAMISQDRVISIHDSIAFSATASVDSALFKSYTWDYEGDGVFDASESVSGKSIFIFGGVNVLFKFFEI